MVIAAAVGGTLIRLPDGRVLPLLVYIAVLALWTWLVTRTGTTHWFRAWWAAFRNHGNNPSAAQQTVQGQVI